MCFIPASGQTRAQVGPCVGDQWTPPENESHKEHASVNRLHGPHVESHSRPSVSAAGELQFSAAGIKM